ncbi:hypothetical protein DPMN_043753 [Dreissena polymorpha]|uniref:Uncharacterized protein n=1 Tax=Dreissena polymorpha TaxID=45954 RepID=A0A9D4D2Z8_DREPO|nr:hypothetical protein DPMN_043753 [Dreissena polymorpha]
MMIDESAAGLSAIYPMRKQRCEIIRRRPSSRSGCHGHFSRMSIDAGLAVMSLVGMLLKKTKSTNAGFD